MSGTGNRYEHSYYKRTFFAQWGHLNMDWILNDIISINFIRYKRTIDYTQKIFSIDYTRKNIFKCIIKY